ncbi:MAG: bifunctional precorrin-2 dehydrogenase/sirohydrochlorin ferrochelatase [Anaerolineae bacterium]|nr:bifunctional precorrin-2 dehydrogenase/sirohydrochlorin ferrochelatase [Anaerolineae bacterium]
MKGYPVFLNDLDQRRCVVVGGSAEAERKVAGLLECEANITVIAAAVTPQLRAWAEAGRIGWLARPYRRGDLKDAFLVICDGANPEVNAQVWQEGEEGGALVNVMDDIPHCNFIAGSVVRRGPLVIAISTGGAAPALAVRLREQFEAQFGAEYGEFLEMVAALRPLMAQRFPSYAERRARYYALVDSDILALLRADAPEAADEQLKTLLAIR